jgi:putative ABC transport system substrate-binding protein
MRRREFIGFFGGAAAAVLPIAGRAQTLERKKRIGVLLPYAESDTDSQRHLAAFRDSLAQLGWTDTNVRIDYRWTGGDAEKTIPFARELIEVRPDVILGRSTLVTAALLKVTRTVPIIFVVVSDPVGDGFVASMARPGGNATGFTNAEASLSGKWLELVKELAPQNDRVAVIYGQRAAAGSGSYYLRNAEQAAASMSISLTMVAVQDVGDIATKLSAFAREARGSLLVLPDATTTFHRKSIFDAAMHYKLPAVYAFRYFVAEGGLASYGVDVTALYRGAATYADRILRGDSPANLPVQAPTKFEMAFNLKTAATLGLTIPPTLLARADEVIE